MKVTSRCAFAATVALLAFAHPCLGLDDSGTRIDKKTVLDILQAPLDAVTQGGFVRGPKRRLVDPVLIEVLNDFASTNSSEKAVNPHRKVIFENLMLWLSAPPNAEALIGVNEILRKPGEDWLRVGSLTFLERLDGDSGLCFPVTGGVHRLRLYYSQTSPAVPLVAQLMAKALAQHGDATGRQLLLTTLRDTGTNQHRRIECARALLCLDAKCDDALAFVSAYLSDDSVSKYEKSRTKEVLFEVGDERGRAWVKGLLSSTNGHQVLFASLILVRHGDLGGITNALRLLQNPDPEVVRRARQLLERSVPNEPVESLDPRRLKWNEGLGLFEVPSGSQGDEIP